MCGIWGTFEDNPDLSKWIKKNKRGPDNSTLKKYECCYLGFHRLSIIDTKSGDQPFTDRGLTLICNGEIYNYKQLIERYNLPVRTNSDCEVILYLYDYFNGHVPSLVDELDGVFAFIIYEHATETFIAARDKWGVRPIFYNKKSIASEAKYLSGNDIEPLNPFFYLEMSSEGVNTILIQDSFLDLKNDPEKTKIVKLFTEAVKKRLMSDVPLGCLLSGGLDSSIVAAVAADLIRPKKLKTFTIGFKDSPDIEYSKIVADYIKSDHTIIEITPEEAIAEIDNVIYATETFDITTIRASVCQYILAKYISENTDIKVILNGDGADELMQGYVYFNHAPNACIAHDENVRLLKEIYKYDGLRVDRTLSAWGLEARLPFLDKHFVNYWMSISKEIRWTPDLEKKIFRDAFKYEYLLPHEILYRKKEAFSDGISPLENSWHKILVEKLKNESLYFKLKYKEYFGENKLIDYYWLPKWTTATDPSAREIK